MNTGLTEHYDDRCSRKISLEGFAQNALPFTVQTFLLLHSHYFHHEIYRDKALIYEIKTRRELKNVLSKRVI